MSFVGAKWWKFDLHTHSPASLDYGKGDTNLRENITPKDWLLGYIYKGIECVAITDHHSSEWVDALKVAAQNLRYEGYSIHVFPGVEITTNTNIHLLGIFDPIVTSSEIDTVITSTQFQGEMGSDEPAGSSVEDTILKIQNLGGVAILAHINAKGGVCQQHSSQVIQQACQHANAVEVLPSRQEHKDAPLSRYSSLSLNLPSIIGSNAQHPNQIDSAFTWIKMSTPSIEGLKLALIDGSSSIIRSDENVIAPNQTSDVYIRSVKVLNARYAGQSTPLKVEFNPWLNAIIGGRGSGKSSILEFIRIGMDRSRELVTLKPDNEIRRTFERFVSVPTTQESNGVMQDNTEIICEYVKDSIPYQLQWSKESNTTAILRKDGADWIAEDGDATTRFPISIFSQKQIFDIAKNPNMLLGLIDESSTVDHQQWKMDWDEKCSHFHTLCSQRRELLARLSNQKVLLGQLSDVEQKIKTIENSGHKEILRAYQSFQVKRSNIYHYEANIEDLAEQVRSIVENVQIPEMDAISPKNEAYNESEVVHEIEALYQRLYRFAETVAIAADTLTNELGEFRNWYAGSDFNRAHIAADEQYNKSISDLNTHGIMHPSSYADLIDEREQIKKSLKELKTIEVQLNELSSKINTAYQSIIDSRKQLTINRFNFLNHYLSDNENIKVEITPLGSGEGINRSFREVIGCPDNTFVSELFDTEKETGFLLTLTQELQAVTGKEDKHDLEPWFALIHKFKSEVYRFGSGHIFENEVGDGFIEFMSQLSPQIFDDINLWFPEDRVTIKFNDGSRFKDVSQGSAGQKASTVLSFLLSYGNEPLILDQPEDDLDNGLISKLIVSNLKRNKSNRQVIVVTHNPNIVVNGDSEYVIALENSGQINVAAAGSLQEANIRKRVCEIMEGGESALEQRYRRMSNL